MSQALIGSLFLEILGWCTVRPTLAASRVYRYRLIGVIVIVVVISRTRVFKTQGCGSKRGYTRRRTWVAEERKFSLATLAVPLPLLVRSTDGTIRSTNGEKKRTLTPQFVGGF